MDRVANIVWQFGDDAQLAGVQVDAATLRVDYWWKGSVPDGLLSALKLAPQEVTVTEHAADYSLSEMRAAGHRVFAAGLGGTIPTVSFVELPLKGTGIGVYLDPDDLPAPGTPARSNLESTVTELAAIPATLSASAAPVLTSRQNDFDPWFGGSAMSVTTAGNADCSTGFAVLKSSGAGRLLSAAHCDYTGNHAWYDGVGDPLTPGGSMVAVAPNYDSMLIDPIGGTNGYVYGGPWNATTANPRYKLKVAGADSPSLGGVVCTSGANSGEHCGLDIIRHTMLLCPGSSTGGLCDDGWQAESPSHTVSTVGGDSGGSVYHDWGDGTVGARGIINSGAGPVTCPSTASPPITGCFYQVFFIDIVPILNHWGVSIEVG